MLHVEVLLPVEAYGKVTRGMEVEVLPEIPADARYRATVNVIDRMRRRGERHLRRAAGAAEQEAPAARGHTLQGELSGHHREHGGSGPGTGQSARDPRPARDRRRNALSRETARQSYTTLILSQRR